MPARTLAYRLLLLCPLLYVGAIGVRARLSLDPYVFTACTAKQQAAFLAYRSFYTKAVEFQSLPHGSVNRELLRQTTLRWIEGIEDGSLQQLTPVHLDDFARDGIKRDITRVRDSLACHLMAIARLEANEGRLDHSANDLILALKVGEAMKYSDPYAVAHAGIVQRTIMMELNEVGAKSPPASRLWIRGELLTLRSQQKPLEAMARLMSRLYRDTATSTDYHKSFEKVDALLSRRDEADQLSVSYLASLPKPSSHTNLDSPYMGLLRMCGISQTSWFRRIDQVIDSLATPVTITSIAENPEGAKLASISP